MSRLELWITIGLMAAVTLLPRILPFWVLGKKQIPKEVTYWLSFVPVCLLGAIVLPSVLVHKGDLSFSLGNHSLWASIPALAAALISRNIFPTILVGMASICVLRGIF